MKQNLNALILFPLLMVFAACSKNAVADKTSGSSSVQAGMKSIAADSLLERIRVLSSDEFEGRAPGTHGEELTIHFLAEQFRKLGLKPGNPNGTYLQNVPMIGFKSSPEAYFVHGAQKLDLKFPGDFVAVSRHFQSDVEVNNSDMVFVGYGIEAPEYGWDDYKGVDVAGKTLVMLINDPPVPDPNDGSRLDENVFKGRAMTYYGRWTYKYEVASKKGAAAAVIIHESGPAGYPYEVVVDSWGRENFDIAGSLATRNRVAVESWINADVAKILFRTAGKDFDSLKRSAVRRDFRPVHLGVMASFRIKNTLREIQSRNVIARVDGSDPAFRNEYVIFSAHWDHLGKDENLKGDQIYNGALDNASGTAGLLSLAEAFMRLPAPPKRTILFLALTAEEQGLLGARHYVENPLYPLGQTLADINMDGLNPWGRTHDITVIGLGDSTLDDLVREVAKSQGRIVKPDAEPEKGFFYRSDHFEFAKQGVPVLYANAGTDLVGKSSEYSMKKRNDYTSRNYHKVSDEVNPDWDLGGAVEDLQLLFQVGWRIAQEPEWPAWKPGSEFKARRDEMLRK